MEQLVPELLADEFDDIQVVPQARPAGGVSVYQLPTYPKTCVPVIPCKRCTIDSAVEGNVMI